MELNTNRPLLRMGEAMQPDPSDSFTTQLDSAHGWRRSSDLVRASATSQEFNVLILLAALLGLLGGTPSLAQDMRPTLHVSGGIKPGYPNHSFADPELLFTWTKAMRVSGSGWTEGAVQILLRGPLNSPGVLPDEYAIGSLGVLFGGINRAVTIPYEVGIGTSTLRILRPGRYEVIGRQFGELSTDLGRARSVAIAPELINISPATSAVRDFHLFEPEYNTTTATAAVDVARSSLACRIDSTFCNLIDWGHERGTRTGLLEGISPELVDPHWISVWDERPIEVYGTVTPTGHNLGDISGLDAEGNNQPAIVTHQDYPGDNFGHDVNVMLVPDREYQWVLGTANYYAREALPDYRENGRIEIEWEFLNRGIRVPKNEEIRYGEGNVGMPAFVIPTVGDRVYAVGRWILDSGHPEVGARTEIHPPRLIATMRKNDTAIPLIDQPGVLTRASQVDIYVSGHGGGANQFLDRLSEALNNGGNGGGRIQDVLSDNNQAIYYKPGPLSQAQKKRLEDIKSIGGPDKIDAGCDRGILLACLIKDLDPGKLAPPAGPTGVGWGGRGPELRPINDMDYEFIVAVPPPPPGATQLFYEWTDQPQHTTGVNEILEFAEPDAATGRPMVRIRLPYRDADNGIYARTLKFAWNTFSQPGSGHHIDVSSISVNASGDGPSSNGEWQMWTDIGGHWFYLTGLSNSFLNAKDGLVIDLLGQASADVFLDLGSNLHVLTYGYDSDDYDGFFGSLDKDAYELGLDLLEQALSNGGVTGLGNQDNDLLGGALFEHSVFFTPSDTDFTIQSAGVKGEGDGFPVVSEQILCGAGGRQPSRSCDITTYFEMRVKRNPLALSRPRLPPPPLPPPEL